MLENYKKAVYEACEEYGFYRNCSRNKDDSSHRGYVIIKLKAKKKIERLKKMTLIEKIRF